MSNVPVVMLLLPSLQALPAAVAHQLWFGLAAFSTLVVAWAVVSRL